ncbi:hypothetical protein GGX14DRAFT_623762 [Mycena pura]|uniref:Uncharacterized protein n=1 Tax=Mycena pura TaxID=153505 RepID=A0AAD6VGA5_9AGAR|nr:hypothetical protein GGX14DRAFT_623762 [Mycena pura]
MATKRPADSNDDPNPNLPCKPKLEDQDHYDAPNLNEKDMEVIKDSLKMSFPSDYQQLNASTLRLLFYEVAHAARGKRAGIKLTDVDSFVSLAMGNVVLREDCRKAIVEHDPRDLLRNRQIMQQRRDDEIDFFDIDPMVLSAVKEAWDCNYVGDFAEILVQAIDKALGSSAGGYSNLGSIIQSSGYGKSRMVDEVAKSRFTFPFNLRPAEESASLAYPHPDNCVREYFSRKHKQNVLTRDRLFFLHLFDLTFKKLNSIEFESKTAAELPELWREWLKSNRSDFYGYVARTAEEDFIEKAEQKTYGIFELNAALMCLLKRLGAPDKGLALFLYFDEVHSLFFSADKDAGVRRWDTLCSTLAHLTTIVAEGTQVSGKRNVFCLSLSTASHFRVIKYMAPSSRQPAPTVTLFAPFTSTPFDIMEPFDPSTKTFGDLERVTYLAQFGRPLWRSMLKTGSGAVMRLARVKLSGKPEESTPRSLVFPSDDKLGPIEENGKFSAKFLTNFAAVSTRVLIDVEPERETGRRLIATLVRNHLRTVFFIPENRDHMMTGVPSEPILAEAAAVIMHRNSKPIRMMEFLKILLQSNLIGNGERGELVARALLIMAIDEAIHKEGRNVAIDEAVREQRRYPFDLEQIYDNGKTAYHKVVPVKEFIEALFADKHHRAVMESLPENVNPDNKPPTFEKAFENGYVCFTHFMRFGEPEDLNNPMAFLAFIRGAAAQFNHPTFDMGVPVAILPEGEDLKSCPLSAVRWTWLLFSVKGREAAQSGYWMNTDNPGLWESKAPPVPNHDFTPVATFVMELSIFRRKPAEGDPSSASTSSLPTEIKPKAPPTRTSPWLSTNKHSHPRYAFVITGCTAEVYSVIKEAEKDSYRTVLSAGGLATETPRYELVAKNFRAAKPTVSYNTDCWNFLSPKFHEKYDMPDWEDLELDVDQGSVEVLKYQDVDGDDDQVEEDTAMDIVDGGVGPSAQGVPRKRYFGMHSSGPLKSQKSSRFRL